MFQYQCLNPISKVGLDGFTNDYIKTEEIEKADAILVRSASMHEMKLPENIQAIARAGAGVNNIPLKDCAEQGISPSLQGFFWYIDRHCREAMLHRYFSNDTTALATPIPAMLPCSISARQCRTINCPSSASV